MKNQDNRPGDAAELRRRAEERLAARPTAATQPGDAGRMLHELQAHQIELEMQSEELRQAQAELDAARARYFDLYDLAPVGYCTVSEQELILEANLTAATLLGVARSALVKQPITRFILTEDEDIYHRLRQQLFEAHSASSGQAGEPQAIELRMVKQDGTIFWAHMEATAEQVADGAPVCRVVLSDITERKQAEVALRQSVARWQAIINTSPDGICIASMEGVIQFVSGKLLADHDYERPEDMVGKPMFEFLDAAYYETATTRLQDMLNGRYTGVAEYRLIKKDGARFYMDINAEVLRDDSSQPVGILFVEHNTTVRRQIEAQLQELNQQLETRVAQRTQDLTHANTALQSEIARRKRAESQVGLQRDLAVALGATAEQAEAYQLVLQAVCQVEGVDCGGAYRVDSDTGNVDLITHIGLSEAFVTAASRYGPDTPQAKLVVAGKPVYIDGSSFTGLGETTMQHEGLRSVAVLPIQHEGRPVALLNCGSHTLDRIPTGVRDTLEAIASQTGGAIARFNAEKALTDSQRNLQSLFDTLNDFLFIIDGDGRILLTNPVVQQRLGYSIDELSQLNVLDMHPPERRQEVTTIVADMLAGRAMACPVPLITKHGVCIPVETKVVRGRWSGRDVLFGVSRDTSERIRAEEEVRRALAKEQELNELKTRFIANTSHEFRTPLAIILSSAEMLEHYADRLTPDKRLRYVGQIQTSTKHLAGLMEDILTLERADAGRLLCQPAPMDVARLCEDLVEEFRLMTHGQCAITFGSSGDCSSASLDKKLVRTILVNLLSNAIKYSPGGGAVECEVVCQDTHVIFTVRDHGIGIPPDSYSRLFDSFHRGRNVGNIPGTGLGMPVAKRCVDAHGGDIQFTSQVGAGSTFVVTLPTTPGDGGTHNDRPG